MPPFEPELNLDPPFAILYNINIRFYKKDINVMQNITFILSTLGLKK